MADEAFALSPISARAVQPGEEDYAAISEAFMETSRGRWFLTEYAKRNRNADTRMVLDAVARIEASIAAQREEGLAAQREESLAAQKQAAADDTIPQVAPMFWSFRIMVGLGILFLFIFAASFFFLAIRNLAPQRWLMRLAVLCIPLPWIASELGWFVAEYGRQPWTISR